MVRWFFPAGARRVGHTLAAPHTHCGVVPSNEWFAPAACPAWHCSHCRRRSPSLTRFRPRRRRLRLFSLSQWSWCSRHCASCDKPCNHQHRTPFRACGLRAPQQFQRRAASRCRYLKPGCASCFSECAQTRNMALGCAALWLLAIKNALASGSSQLCEKAQGKKEKLSSGVLS